MRPLYFEQVTAMPPKENNLSLPAELNSLCEKAIYT